MSELWKKLAADYIKCYKAIQFLHEQGIFDEEERNVHMCNVLKFIIEDFEGVLNPSK